MAVPARNWSAEVAWSSNAPDFEPGVFALDNPKRIAESLKCSALNSTRRMAAPFRSATSMLCFYLNRAGRHLPDERRVCLEAAKDELRAAFGRPRRQN